MLKKVSLAVVALLLLGIVGILAFADPFKKKTRAGLQIEYPSGNGASVFLGEDYLGKAPLLEEKLQSGEYILKITPDDTKLSNLNLPIYLEEGTLTIVVYNPGETPRSSSSTVFELRKKENKESSVSFETYPENAFISFDGGEVAFSPLTIDSIQAGEHHFSVNLPSYEAQEHSFLVLEGYETKVTINLAKNLKLADETIEKTNEATASVIQAKIQENTPTPSASRSASGIISPQVEILRTNFFNDGQEVLKAREASSSSAKEVGFALVGSFYPYLGEKSADGKWLKIQLREQTAWISNDFAKVIANNASISATLENNEPK